MQSAAMNPPHYQTSAPAVVVLGRPKKSKPTEPSEGIRGLAEQSLRLLLLRGGLLLGLGLLFLLGSGLLLRGGGGRAAFGRGGRRQLHAAGRPQLLVAVLADDELPDGLDAVVAEPVEGVEAAAVAVPARAAELDDAGVPALPVGEPLGHVVDDLLGETGVLHGAQDPPARRKVADLAERDQVLRGAAELLGLRLGGDDPAVDEEALDDVPLQRLPVRRRPSELSACQSVTHASLPTPKEEFSCRRSTRDPCPG